MFVIYTDVSTRLVVMDPGLVLERAGGGIYGEFTFGKNALK